MPPGARRPGEDGERLDEARVTYEYLDGRTRDRQRRVGRLQSYAACGVFLVSLKAGGVERDYDVRRWATVAAGRT